VQFKVPGSKFEVCIKLLTAAFSGLIDIDAGNVHLTVEL